jgi:hypothetical protein
VEDKNPTKEGGAQGGKKVMTMSEEVANVG